MKKLIFLFSVAILAALGCSKNSEDIQIEDTSGERIPVLAWVGVPSAHTSVERYQEMADAGFTWSLPWDLCHNDDFWAESLPSTHLPHIKDINEYIKALDAAQATGMKILVASGVLNYFTGDDLRRIREHPALLGYVIADEPSPQVFDILAGVFKFVVNADPGHLPYINLLGGYGDSYRQYLQDFMSKVPMPFYSFDHYPVVQDRIEKLLKEWDFKTEINPNPRRIRDAFFENLEIIAGEAKKTGKPFWGFVLSTWHISDCEYPIPTISDLRFQVYSMLAYGAQCIEYFSYWALNFGKEAPIEKDGRKTLTYYNVRKMNEEIKNLSRVFLNATVVWTAHTGVIPQGCTELDMKKLPPVFKSLDISGPGALVSLLEKGKDRFLVIVNHDIHHTVNVQASISPRVRRVSKDGSVVAAGAGQDLDPGDAVIYFWKEK